MERHNNCDAENFFITASKEELIDYFVKKINSEVEKGDDADCDLIRECSDWLDELTEDEIVFTPEELERNLKRIKVKAVSDKPFNRSKKISRKTFVRVALIAAVIFTISILSLSAVASNKGYNSTWKYVSENIVKLFRLNDGDEISENRITIIKYSGKTTYNDIEELIEEESLNIYYPSDLPRKSKILEIRQVLIDNEQYMLIFSFSDNALQMRITNYCSVDFSKMDDSELAKINDIDYCIKAINNDTYHAICQIEGFEYYFQYSNYDELIQIISSMKG